MQIHHLPGCMITSGSASTCIDKIAHRQACVAGSGYTPLALAHQRDCVPFAQYILLDQVHGSGGITITSSDGLVPYQPYAITGDYIITTLRHVACCVATADCAPICLYAPYAPAIASIHAGWRGVADGVIANAISDLCSIAACTPASVYAYIGPSARGCCYAVGPDVIEAVAATMPNTWRIGHDGYYLDLGACVYEHLRRHGIPAPQIHAIPACTICHPHYVSHRENKTPYRQITYGTLLSSP